MTTETASSDGVPAVARAAASADEAVRVARARFLRSEQPRSLGNAFSFFKSKADPQELRYASDEEQSVTDTNMPFAGDDLSPTDPDPRAAPRLPTLKMQFWRSERGEKPDKPEKPEPGAAAGALLDNSRKLLGIFRKKKDRRPESETLDATDLLPADDMDHETAERALALINSMALGAPAINLLASCLCEDEYGIARAPLLLTLLGLQVTDVSGLPALRNRKFRIDLEYGVAPERLTWLVEKTARDLLYLHLRFKLLVLRGTFKSDELPHYPVPPLLRRDRKTRMFTSRRGDPVSSGIDHELEQHDDHVSSIPMLPRDNASDTGSFRDRISTLRSHLSDQVVSSAASLSFVDASPEQVRSRMISNQRYVHEVAKYLTDLATATAMRPQLNRLFHFFEILPILALLTYERYSGKQGVVHVGGTAKAQGWRVGHFKVNDLKNMIDRRSEKWLLVRPSYVMYVSDINSTTPLEVFLVDPSFKISALGGGASGSGAAGAAVGPDSHRLDSESEYEADLLNESLAEAGKSIDIVQNKVFKHLRIVLRNNERKLLISPRSKKERELWLRLLHEMARNSIWAQHHRFDSFAPVRKNCFAQYFVEARDYFWAVLLAIEMAKDTVFIHDWWLSPELYLRRPANGAQQFRIDRLLQRKAQQGVKIFVIVYRNVGTTIPIDSLYTKHLILSLNQENIHVIRSPNQLLQNTYFWAHHEKICVVDYNLAFLGGIDLCYGRYDTSEHTLVDDSPVDFLALNTETLTEAEFSDFRIFPGKDYSNTRVKDFLNLDKPYESMYDREVVPRMPWHDIHMMTTGQPANDLARHFVQRWNYLVRQKRPSRLTPLLTPPPGLTDEEVVAAGLGGTCEVQLLRSAGNWSLGLHDHEQSIQNAYLKLIETSEHFVYIENQFFVTSCFIEGTEIKNRVGDALVDRIIRAHKEGTNWKAIIVIPLVPGFESQVDKPDGSSVRVVMQCEYMSISRGTSSLFAKLRKVNIDPDEYIQFFSLRKWGIIGPDRNLVTEQLYIHAKTMIVDDRTVIIGSANINERSMRGSRDSEVAAIVRDTKTVQATMDGQPYQAHEFAHNLRMRLMREHLGVDIDSLDLVERKFARILDFAASDQGLSAATTNFSSIGDRILSAAVELASRLVLDEPDGTPRWHHFTDIHDLEKHIFEVPRQDSDKDDWEALALPLSFNNRTGPHEANKGLRDKKKHSYDTRVQLNQDHKLDVYGEGVDKYRTKVGQKARLDSRMFLKDLTKASMKERPHEAFLPDVENLRSFLELDDHEYPDTLSEEDEKTLAARNRERWLLLKRVSYLQKVLVRLKKQQGDESKRREAAGLPLTLNGELPGSVEVGKVENGPTEKHNGLAGIKSNGLVGAPGKPVSSVEEENVVLAIKVPDVMLNDQPAADVAPERGVLDSFSPDPSCEQIPIVALNASQHKQMMQLVNLSGIDNDAYYVDPYIFEDPVDPDFYEDIWYENARRNTDLFRLVFHCQPDDFVPLWKEYKQFMKMENAFKYAQTEDAKIRKEKARFERKQNNAKANTGQDSTPPTHFRRASLNTINMGQMGDDGGILGDVSEGLKPRSGSVRNMSLHNSVPEGNESEDSNFADAEEPTNVESSSNSSGGAPKAQAKTPLAHKPRRGRRAGTFSARRKIHIGERIFERETAHRLLEEVRGHLVLFPVDWLMHELEGGNWFFNTDRLPPIEIYD